MSEFNPEGTRRRGRPSNAEIAARQAAKTGHIEIGDPVIYEGVAQSEPSPSRETRAETTRRERRFRPETGDMADLKLAVPEHLKKPGYTQRWVNDTIGGRVQNLHGKDWDIVKNPAIEGQGEGTPVARNVGTGEHGQPMRAYLMEKPEDWHQEDQGRKNAKRLEVEDQMMRGPSPQSGLTSSEAYVPQGHVNRITRG